jgi:hypothetical protein
MRIDSLLYWKPASPTKIAISQFSDKIRVPMKGSGLSDKAIKHMMSACLSSRVSFLYQLVKVFKIPCGTVLATAACGKPPHRDVMSVLT